MLGVSVFLDPNQHQENLTYIKEMKNLGIEGVFTSLHIPEDDASQYPSLLKEVGQLCKELQLNLSIDISAKSLEKIGYSLHRVEQLSRLGVSCIRPDYGIDNQLIASLTHKIDVALNASTIDLEDIIQLKNFGANFEKLEAWHNYYPRPETGLNEVFFDNKNKFLRNQGFKVMAFIPGDNQMRGPIFESLPTLEKHRKKNPFYAFLDLKNTYSIDKIYLGDPGLSPIAKAQFVKYLSENVIILRALKTNQSEIPIRIRHTNRMDPGAFAIRSQESRIDFKGIKVKAQATRQRKRGVITLDNYKYQRYQGELQIVVNSLPADPKVNVIGEVIEQDIDLLDFINPGQEFEIKWKEGR
ncbi:DUF871 domain-containing protein [Facklamia sp. 7083-14-GEN3]|uniref:DUF871 domain-containing protein n=1 Tax=Facklamia sp. 7083-14-GEN3 TaxID=2973478 RepID=UPI00215D4ADE|nr:MupG family TIM beta-alpha barrel fold protein [Facklamia sp. 7083-14-GEN3]MCR8968585.1 MupG family TIM beta-alpha barrel fold protein [Facklamia sp. 7083-14-GEN3]